jgi:heterodisulfide reductase subunit C
MGMIAFYNLKSGQLFKDAMLAPTLLANRKISPFPHKIQGQQAVQKIFAKAKAMGGERL